MESTEKDLTERVEAEGREAMERVKQALERTDDEVRHMVASHPMLTLFGAATIGYFVGRLIARR